MLNWKVHRSVLAINYRSTGQIMKICLRDLVCCLLFARKKTTYLQPICVGQSSIKQKRRPLVTLAHRIFVSDCRIHQTQCVEAHFLMRFHNECIVSSFICYFLHMFIHLKHEISCLLGLKLLKLCRSQYIAAFCIKHLKDSMPRIKCYELGLWVSNTA